jgi:hypothetical protein
MVFRFFVRDNLFPGYGRGFKIVGEMLFRRPDHPWHGIRIFVGTAELSSPFEAVETAG